MADPDKLARLQAARRRKAEAEEEANAIRDELIAEGIAEDGQVYFTGIDGEKHRGYFSDSEEVTVNLDALAKEVTPEVFAVVTKTVLDREAFERAMRTKVVTNSVVAKVASVRRVRPTIRFDSSGGDYTG